MKKRKSPLLTALTLLLILAAGAVYFFVQPGADAPTGVSPALPEFSASADSALLRVIYLDVGQGDSALILSPDGKTMLIDAGESTAKKKVASVLSQYGVSAIDMLVATHPHSDHIGGMQYILENFEVRKICMPSTVHTSKTYEKLLATVREQGIPALQAKAGKSFPLGEEVNCQILAPAGDSYENLNDYSAVLRVCFGESSFLFTGDAEFLSESEMLEGNFSVLASTVLKVGHHGSHTSSSGEFLDAVAPKAAVISCGMGNSYGHPHTETMEALAKRGVTVYRTDELGDILAYSDGKSVQFAKSGAVPAPASDKIQEVYVTENGKSYHKKSCQYYRADSVKLSIAEAKSLGYAACTKCFSN